MRLNTREVDAVVDTVMLQINQKNENSPEQKEYERLCKLETQLERDAESEFREFKKTLIEKYSKLSEGLEVEEYSYNNKPLTISSPTRPESSIDRSTIERELIIANISGNIQETMKQIIEKYTK